MSTTVKTPEKIAGKRRFDPAVVRGEFPILSTRVHGKPLAFLDSAASSQKPEVVIETIANYYRSEHSNIHRGVYYLSEIATAKYEAARETTRRFLNAGSTREIIFTAGTTDAINLVANAYGREFFREGDEVLISGMEHHANIVSWQLVCQDLGAKLKVIPINERGELDLESLPGLISERTRMVGIVYVSNSLGTVNPVKEVIRIAHQHGVPVLVDAAQATSHLSVDVQDLDADFLAMSGHKVYGPTGVGVLYGKEHHLEKMRPFKGGGDMIRSVTFEKTTFNDLPFKFEAGTPNIAGVIGLAAALEYVMAFDINEVAAWEDELLQYGENLLAGVPGLRRIGTAAHRAGSLAFVLADVHPHDIGTLLDHEGVAIRTGHHCTQPVMSYFKVPATSRASVAMYNNKADLEALQRGLLKIVEVFR
ncbi:MAG: cysteine desulfurase [Calditrichaeota bacterium]|nr:cysteine desulfurase [Calditrichota bacterium]